MFESDFDWGKDSSERLFKDLSEEFDERSILFGVAGIGNCSVACVKSKCPPSNSPSFSTTN